MTRFLRFASAAVFVLGWVVAQGAGQDGLIRIRETAALPVQPDTLYLLMRVETHQLTLSAAAAENQDQIDRFTAALIERSVPKDAIQVSNYLVESSLGNPGINFSRNLIIQLAHIDKKTPEEVNRLIAVFQDVGARYGSSCITCIGSG